MFGVVALCDDRGVCAFWSCPGGCVGLGCVLWIMGVVAEGNQVLIEAASTVSEKMYSRLP